MLVAIPCGTILWGIACDALAARHLAEANSHVELARSAVLRLESNEADTQLANARERSRSAEKLTEQFGPALLAKIPVAGRPFLAVQDMAKVAVHLTSKVLPPAVKASELVATQGLRNGIGVNLAVISQARDGAHEAAAEASRATAMAKAIPTTRLKFIDDRVTIVRRKLEEIGRQTTFVDSAAQLLPRMLGANGPRSYFIGFQTNSEARGTGGLVGGGAIARFDDGRMEIDNAASRTAFTDTQNPIGLGPDFESLYGDFDPTQYWVNSNLSPHFPYAGAIWQHLWQEQSGERVDGSIAVDPVALSYILQVIGPVTLGSGEVVSADNVVALTESEEYFRFGDDVVGRKAFLSEIAGAVAIKVGRLEAPVPPLLNALGRGVSEGRIAVWSDHSDEQVIIMNTPLAHAVPYSPAPYANIVINNSGGNKLDYYLERQLSYSGGDCDGTTRETTASVQLLNTAPNGLPDSIIGPQFLGTRERGTHRVTVAVIATWGAELRSAEVNGQAVRGRAGREMGHPVFEVDVEVPQGNPVNVAFHLVEPVMSGPPSLPVQPLVAKTTSTLALREC
ncbi:MAG: DUF4012 domain-containing protein [Nocardiaceae bacterium]|nr:DUF4012 domain-containing protein [Nocardiaceae bacterium]